MMSLHRPSVAPHRCDSSLAWMRKMIGFKDGNPAAE